MSGPSRRKTAAKPPPAWRRESAGTYRSADGRFELAGDGAGRWFVRDLEALDELGLPRTTGPLSTLAEAKAAAETQREAGAVASPLAGRLEAPRPEPAADTQSPGHAAGAPATLEGGGGASARPRARAPEAVEEGRGARRPGAAAQRTTRSWLDELEATDPRAARAARARVRALEQHGIAAGEADSLVRRDLLGGMPAVAERLVLDAVRARVAAVLPSAIARSGATPEQAAAIAALVMTAALGAIDAGQPEAPADPALPGWQLLERGSGRRIRPIAGEG